MALAAAVAMLCYALIIFVLGLGYGRAPAADSAAD
jgi:hypothetical protein